jgi:hypothetical protein
MRYEFGVPVVDGAALDLFPDFQAVETIAFVDRRYLGVIATKPGGSLYYASLMIKFTEEADQNLGLPACQVWRCHTLQNAMTDSISNAREMVLAAYNALIDRPRFSE